MKIIILIEKYGGFCNRLFQSTHYHAYSIHKGINFYNPTMLGLLKFNNFSSSILDQINNFILKLISKPLNYLFKNNQFCLYFNKKNYIKFVKGWDFRNNELTIKYHKKLKNIYGFDRSSLSKKAIYIVKYISDLRKRDKFIIGLHLRRKDYASWNKGKYYFSDEVYNNLIYEIKKKFKKDNREPFLFIVSDQKISSNLNYDYYCKGTWKDDQIILQNCDLIVGPPSTFTMWASYIAEIPLIQINSEKFFNLENQIICRG